MWVRCKSCKDATCIQRNRCPRKHSYASIGLPETTMAEVVAAATAAAAIAVIRHLRDGATTAEIADGHSHDTGHRTPLVRHDADGTWRNDTASKEKGFLGQLSVSELFSTLYYTGRVNALHRVPFWLHCALSLAPKCILIGPVCGFVCMYVALLPR